MQLIVKYRGTLDDRPGIWPLTIQSSEGPIELVGVFGHGTAHGEDCRAFYDLVAVLDLDDKEDSDA